MSILQVNNLFIKNIKNNLNIVEGINFNLEKNRCLGIVGESGSGKSLTAKSILGILNPNLEASGEIIYKGKDLMKLDKESLRKVRGEKICMILQDAMSSFDPLYTIGDQITETIIEHKGLSKEEATKIAITSLESVNIIEPETVIKKYPHQLSGGMLQRCMIAIALSMKPEIIIADEPTTALDSINQREIVEEMKRLKNNEGMSLIFISHDLGIVQYLADDILVMKNGEAVEYGKANDIFKQPKHEYTKYLIGTRMELTKSFNESIVDLNCKEEVI